MDEFMFRSSQQFDHLQYQMGVALSEGSKVIKNLTYSSKNALITALNSPQSVQIQDSISNFCYYCWTVLDEIRCSILYHVNPRLLFHNMSKIIGSNWSKRDFFFGCAGLLVGSLFGIGIGLAYQRKIPIVKQMMAVQCSSYTGLDNATLNDEALTSMYISDDEVLINVKAASVQIIDADICSGYGRVLRQILSKHQYSKHDLPVTLGRDCAGIVMDIGKNVTRFDIGDEVWTTSPFWAPGTMCQYFIAHELDVALRPSTIGYEQACSLPYAGGIALNTIEMLDIPIEEFADKRVLIQGCCTPVGCILVQLFKLWDSHVTSTCYKRAKPVAEAIKCDDIIVLDGDFSSHDQMTNGKSLHSSLPTANLLFTELLARKQFDIIINTRDCGIEKEQFHEFCRNGIFISTLHPPLYEDSYRFPTSTIYKFYVIAKSYYQFLMGKQIRNYGEVHICNQTLSKLRKMVETGKIKTLVDKVFYPSEIENALYHIQSIESIGSTVITFRCHIK